MATARNSSRKRSKIFLFQTDEQIRTWLGRLPKFEAHDRAALARRGARGRAWRTGCGGEEFARRLRGTSAAAPAPASFRRGAGPVGR
jgi:hypothetical protein